jgi:hypothetical protein
MSTWLQAAAVFTAVAVADFAWTKYMMHAAAKHPHRAALWNSVIIALGSVSVVSYTENHWMLIPALLGAYVGTYVAVRRG